MTPPPEERPPRPPRRLTVSIDLPAILGLLLCGAFVLLAATMAYGFLTHTLDPGIVLGVVSTMFTGLLAGALTASRRNGNGKAGETTDDTGRKDDPP